MSADLANLEIRINSVEADVAKGRLNKLATSGDRSAGAIGRLSGSFLKLAGPAAILAAAGTSMKKLTDVTREFDVLNAQLITATGSSEDAAKAFEAIKRFATETPYDLQQSTEGFTKLVNLGLTPSERALRSYGDTSAAMGKDLSQMVEAVADATTGEFERLKQFGIKAKKNGEEVSFTFRGMTDTVKFNSGEIEQYLTKLGENNFAGSMSNRMATLDGAISNMEDAWNQAWLTISGAGAGDIIEADVRKATDAITELTNMIASGELAQYIVMFDKSWSETFQNIAGYIEGLSTYLEGNFSSWVSDSEVTGNAITDAFLLMPQNIEAGFKMIDVWLDATSERMQAFGPVLADTLNPFSDRDMQQAWADFDQQIAGIDQKLHNAYSNIGADRKKAVSDIKVEFTAAKTLRAEYDKLMADKAKASGDALARFKFQKPETDEPDQLTAIEKKAADIAAKKFARVEKDLRSEEEALQHSYDRRLEIILANTEEGSNQQNALKQKLDKQFAADIMEGFEPVSTSEDELMLLEEEFQRKRDVILANTELTEEARTELEIELTKSRNAKIQAIETAKNTMMLGAGEKTFGSLASIAKNFAGEQSKIYKVMFAASKAFAIATSIVKIQQGIAEATALPWPVNLGAIASTVAASASIVSTIMGAQYSGAYDKGGEIGKGQYGLVGEYGPELIEGPVKVTGRQDTAALLNKAGKQGDQNNVQQAAQPANITLNPAIILDSATLTDFLSTPDGEAAILDIVDRNKVA